jgi:hypothetical protein
MVKESPRSRNAPSDGPPCRQHESLALTQSTGTTNAAPTDNHDGRAAGHSEGAMSSRVWERQLCMTQQIDMQPAVVTVDDARSLASTLPRSYEALVRDRVRFRVGRIVYLAFSRDETIMGFAFPKDERDALVASEPEKFLLPRQSELRYNWVCVRLETIDCDELHELIVDAWRMCVPKKVAASYDG